MSQGAVSLDMGQVASAEAKFAQELALLSQLESKLERRARASILTARSLCPGPEAGDIFRREAEELEIRGRAIENRRCVQQGALGLQQLMKDVYFSVDPEHALDEELVLHVISNRKASDLPTEQPNLSTLLECDALWIAPREMSYHPEQTKFREICHGVQIVLEKSSGYSHIKCVTFQSGGFYWVCDIYSHQTSTMGKTKVSDRSTHHDRATSGSFWRVRAAQSLLCF